MVMNMQPHLQMDTWRSLFALQLVCHTTALIMKTYDVLVFHVLGARPKEPRLG